MNEDVMMWNNSAFHIADTILYADIGQHFIVLQRGDSVVWSYLDPAAGSESFISYMDTDGELFNIIITHPDSLEFIIVDVNGNATHYSVALPEEHRLTYGYSLQSKNGQLVFSYFLRGEKYNTLFDVDQNNSDLMFRETHKDTSNWLKSTERCRYQQMLLYETEFLELYVKKHCSIWMEDAIDYCQWTCVFRTSKEI
jgi:hypothetical protein